MAAKNCFVIIGYEKKTSYANGKASFLNLDKTYQLLIKPVFDELNINCCRGIDKNLNGSIDEVMLQEIMNADIAIADISALNANVMWELGVRHTLKPHHTVMIYKGKEDKMAEYETKALAKKVAQANSSYNTQKEKIKQLLPLLKN